MGACGGEWDKVGARAARTAWRQVITHPLARGPRGARFPRSPRRALWRLQQHQCRVSQHWLTMTVSGGL